MHKQLSEAELAAVQAAHPVRPLTKQEKLAMWAALVDKYQGTLQMFSNFENWPGYALDDPKYVTGGNVTAVSLAIDHEPFKAEGIGNTARSVLKFFELTRAEMHTFSCDCGGYIGGKEQARRIGSIARGEVSHDHEIAF